MGKDDLKVSVSGIRGVIGSGLTLETINRYVRAFAKTLPSRSKVIIARDTRGSGNMIKNAVVSVLTAAGHSVIDCAIVPTPTAAYMIRKFNVSGGIVITASHNPIEWNALKLLGKGGRFLNSKELEKLLKYYENDENITVSHDKIGSYTKYPAAVNDHIEEIFSFIDVDAIRKKKYTVACDYVNGTGLTSTPKLLFKLDAKEYSINNAITGAFAHKAEPGIDTMKDLAKVVVNANADVGFTQDPDADRLAIVSEKGEILSEEYTLALAAKYMWIKKKGDAAVNLSTSRMIDDIAEKYGCKVYRTKIGEINVSDKIKDKNLYFGGEGNGGLIYPPVTPGRDSILAIAVILDLMALTEKSISELVSEITPYVMIKDKVRASDIDIEMLKNVFADFFSQAEINDIDGVKADFEDGWVHVRPSNTEPIVRVFAEAKNEKRAKELIESAAKAIKSISS